MSNHSYFKLAFLIALSFASYLFLKEQTHSGIRVPHLDKAAHFVIFFGLAFLLDYGFKLKQWHNLTILSIYGILIELLQGKTGYRDASLADFIADISGIVAYFALTKIPHFKRFYDNK